MPLYRSGGVKFKGSNLIVGHVAKKTEKEIFSLYKQKGLSRDPLPSHPHPAAEPIDVYLNVYDLIDQSPNKTLMTLGFGIFHSAVEILGVEWSFGEADEGPEETGVFGMLSSDSSLTLRDRILLGQTVLTTTQVGWILRGLEKEWPSKKYHIFHCNCNDFAVELARRLQTTELLVIPKWINRAASWADKIVPRRVASWAVSKFEDNVPTTSDGMVPVAASPAAPEEAETTLSSVTPSDLNTPARQIFTSSGGGASTSAQKTRNDEDSKNKCENENEMMDIAGIDDVDLQFAASARGSVDLPPPQTAEYKDISTKSATTTPSTPVASKTGALKKSKDTNHHSSGGEGNPLQHLYELRDACGLLRQNSSATTPMTSGSYALDPPPPPPPAPLQDSLGEDFSKEDDPPRFLNVLMAEEEAIPERVADVARGLEKEHTKDNNNKSTTSEKDQNDDKNKNSHSHLRIADDSDNNTPSASMGATPKEKGAKYEVTSSGGGQIDTPPSVYATTTATPTTPTPPSPTITTTESGGTLKKSDDVVSLEGECAL
eukprot:PhM_4_TR4737/c0_g1_i1/m.59780